MGDHQRRLDAVNLGLFVGVDLNLWPTVYITVIVHADTDQKWIKPKFEIVIPFFCHSQVINLASLKDDQKFYFYDDVSAMSDEPHLYRRHLPVCYQLSTISHTCIGLSTKTISPWLKRSTTGWLSAAAASGTFPVAMVTTSRLFVCVFVCCLTAHQHYLGH